MNIRIMRCKNDLFYCRLVRNGNNDKVLQKVPIIGFTIEISEKRNNAYAKPILVNGDVIFSDYWIVYDAKSCKWYDNCGVQGLGLYELDCFLMNNPMN